MCLYPEPEFIPFRNSQIASHTNLRQHLLPGDKQAKRRPVHRQRRESLRLLPPVLRHRPPERATVRAVTARGEEEPGAAGPGADGV